MRRFQRRFPTPEAAQNGQVPGSPHRGPTFMTPSCWRHRRLRTAREEGPPNERRLLRMQGLRRPGPRWLLYSPGPLSRARRYRHPVQGQPAQRSPPCPGCVRLGDNRWRVGGRRFSRCPDHPRSMVRSGFLERPKFLCCICPGDWRYLCPNGLEGACVAGLAGQEASSGGPDLSACWLQRAGGSRGGDREIIPVPRQETARSGEEAIGS